MRFRAAAWDGIDALRGVKPVRISEVVVQCGGTAGCRFGRFRVVVDVQRHDALVAFAGATQTTDEAIIEPGPGGMSAAAGFAVS